MYEELVRELNEWELQKVNSKINKRYKTLKIIHHKIVGDKQYGVIMRRCHFCKEYFPLTNDYFDKDPYDKTFGLHRRCRPCEPLYKTWHALQKEAKQQHKDINELYNRMSSYELIIAKYLDANNITYVFDSCYFKSLKGIGGGMLRPDFILPDYRRWIEVDGEGHFYPVRFNGCTEQEAQEAYERIKEHDKIKDEYAKNHSFALTRIPYLDFKSKCTINGEVTTVAERILNSMSLV